MPRVHYANNYPRKLSREKIVEGLCKIHNTSEGKHLSEKMAGWDLEDLELLIDKIQNFYKKPCIVNLLQGFIYE